MPSVSFSIDRPQSSRMTMFWFRSVVNSRLMSFRCLAVALQSMWRISSPRRYSRSLSNSPSRPLEPPELQAHLREAIPAREEVEPPHRADVGIDADLGDQGPPAPSASRDRTGSR